MCKLFCRPMTIKKASGSICPAAAMDRFVWQWGLPKIWCWRQESQESQPTDNGMKWGSKSSHIPRSKRTPSTLRSSSGTSWASLPKHTYHMGKPSVTSFGQCNQLSLKIIVGTSIIMKHIPWIVWWRAGSCLPWFVSFCNKANKYRIVASRGTNALYKM